MPFIRLTRICDPRLIDSAGDTVRDTGPELVNTRDIVRVMVHPDSSVNAGIIFRYQRQPVMYNETFEEVAARLESLETAAVTGLVSSGRVTDYSTDVVTAADIVEQATALDSSDAYAAQLRQARFALLVAAEEPDPVDDPPRTRNFRVGERVRCIEALGIGGLRVGELYTVTEASERTARGSCYIRTSPYSATVWLNAARFELVQASPEPIRPPAQQPGFRQLELGDPS